MKTNILTREMESMCNDSNEASDGGGAVAPVKAEIYSPSIFSIESFSFFIADHSVAPDVSSGCIFSAFRQERMNAATGPSST